MLSKEYPLSPIFELMLWAFGKGLLSGVVMSLMLGTVFFSLVQNSIQNGWNKGALIAFGVIISDLIFISLAVIGVSYIDPQEGNKWIEGIAALILMGLGLTMLRKHKPQIAYPETRFGKFLYYFSNGFLLNILNPVNFIFWAGLAAVARTDWGYNTNTLLLYFSGCLISIFVTEVSIAYGAHKVKVFLNDQILVWINRVTGIIFIALSLKLLFDAFFT